MFTCRNCQAARAGARDPCPQCGIQVDEFSATILEQKVESLPQNPSSFSWDDVVKLRLANLALREVVDAFRREEFSLRSDWLGMCPFRRALQCHGHDGRNSALGTPKPVPHDPYCPYFKLNEYIKDKK